MKRLRQFKDREKPETVLLVAGSPLLIKMVVAWCCMSVAKAAKPSTYRGTTDEDAWKWLWENARYSESKFFARIPLPESVARRGLVSLVANRVIYPDGTAHSFVERYLRAAVLKTFSRARRQRFIYRDSMSPDAKGNGKT